ncbi:hypothetical protein BU15DRAFT_69644, partial [Melanogaster broomeanus]
LYCVTSGVTLMLDTGMFATVMHSLREVTSGSRHLYPSPLLHLLLLRFILQVVRALSDVDGSHCFTDKYIQQLVYHRMLDGLWKCKKFEESYYVLRYLDRKQDPRNMLQLGLSFPLLSIVGQRLVLNLRGLQARRYTTRDLSREVNRQMAAMGGTSFWQAVEPWPNGAHEAGHEAQSGVGSAVLDLR